ncbi:AHH domain-containing protein [Microbulbifer sp. CnH-101-G]|uniref:AHH domain-containing protein n=1 Tax=Microbulbifer sp. CnH-101-G TaxID=3243393 RepID=UPI00403907E9
MDIEYNHGVRVTRFIHEMSPLEAAITRFEAKAKAYYKKKDICVAESEHDRKLREKELAEALNHLKYERRRIKAIAQLESELSSYQNWGREKSEEDPLALLDEPHHPTKVLAKNMRADGRPQPSDRHSPHHIVAGKGKHPQTADTRLLLHLYGIRINDPDNGVWMPRSRKDKGHWSMPKSPSHSEIHTYNYETWVNFLLGSLENESVIRSALVRIQSILRDGKQPPKVTEKKDNNWEP